jgi:hypothetical protein
LKVIKRNPRVTMDKTADLFLMIEEAFKRNARLFSSFEVGFLEDRIE